MATVSTRLALAASVLLAGCSAGSDEGDAEGSDSAMNQANPVSGSVASEHILFPGDPACAGGPCETSIAGDDLFIPSRNGNPWGDTYALGNANALSAAGYSSGRIALLRRLALQPDGQKVALLLDPSWPDGQRNFTGSVTTGPAIVKAWLKGDPARKFVLIHALISLGWKEYAELMTSEVGARVRVCAVAATHLDVPRTVGHAAIVSPDTWEDITCKWGGPPPPSPCHSTTLGADVDPGHCVQKSSGAWFRCVSGTNWDDSSDSDPLCIVKHPYGRTSSQ